MKQILTNLKVYLTLLLLCGVSSVWAVEKTITIPIKGFYTDGSSSSSYTNKNVQSTHDGVDFVAYAFNNTSGQIRGNKTSIYGDDMSNTENANNNFHIFNASAIPGHITKIVLKVSEGTLQNKMYAAVGTSTQGAVTSVTGLTSATAENGSFTFNFEASEGYTFFKLCSNEKFTSGTVKAGSEDAIVITYEYNSTEPSINASNLNIASDATSGEIAYTITNPVLGVSLTASSTADWISDISVTAEKVTFKTTANTGSTDRQATMTLKYDGASDKNVTVTQAKYIPVYANLTALLAAETPTADGKTVTVTLTNEKITKIYVSTKNQRNGIYLNVGDKEIEVFCYDVPEEWEVGGTVSGTITCPWKDYNGTWELCPTSWSGLEYTAPEKPKYDVLYSVLGVDAGSEEVSEGEFIKSAPVVKGMAGWKFAGWTTNNNYESSTTAPIFFTSATPVVEDVTLYAVFSKTEGGSGEAWNLVKDASTLQANDVIRLAATVSGASKEENNGTFAASAFGEDGKFFTSTSAEINDDQLTAASAIDITLGGNASGWTLTTSEGFVGTKAAKSMLLNDNSTGVINEWTITIAENGAATITAGDKGKILYNRDSPRFLNYTSSVSASMALPFIFRKEVAGTTTYSTDIPLYYEFEMPAAGYATLYLDFPVAIPYGFDVYRAETYSSSTKEVKLSKMDADGNLPANFGVLVKGKPGDPACFKGFYVPNGMTGIHNLFTGVVEDTPVADVAENTIYVLNAAGSTTDLVKFSEYTGTTLNANKAYLDLDIPAGSNLTFVFDDATAIENVNAAKASAIRVNLAGQVVGKDYKGIVIENGKKFLNK